MENYEKYIDLLRSMLSKKRFQHCLNVADESKRLADKYGADTEKAYLAGLLHDIKKEEKLSDMEKTVRKSKMNVEQTEIETQALWHAIASAEYVKNVLKITDNDIISAIRFHTIGKANMTTLEKVVYLGDLVSIDREYKDVAKMRKSCYNNINRAMFEAMQFAVGDLVRKGDKIPVYTFEAYNYYEKFR